MKASRHHDISCAHRIFGYPGKCGQLHGHNYRITFTCSGEISGMGMVIDFGIIKGLFCEWLDAAWDHKLLLWDKDDLWDGNTGHILHGAGAIKVPFNPTAENMADYLLRTLPKTLHIPEGVDLLEVKVQETDKCSVTASLFDGCGHD